MEGVRWGGKKEQNKEKEEQSPFELANFKAGMEGGVVYLKEMGRNIVGQKHVQ